MIGCRAVLLPTVLLSAACTPAADASGDQAVPAARVVTRFPSVVRKGRSENSAAATSATQRGVVFTINDSGGEPELLAFDTTGADRGTWVLRGATNSDWEAATTGPCTLAGVARRCVYIGDVGDNTATRRSVTIYRLAEPAAMGAGARETVSAERLTVRYSDHANNVESMVVSPDGAIHIITKPGGIGLRTGSARGVVYRLPASAWDRPTETAVAVPTDTLLAILAAGAYATPTDAALSPDGRLLAVRTYRDIFVFATDSATGRVARGTPPTRCNINGLDQDSGEGIGWLGTNLLLTTEDVRVPVHVVQCPLPAVRPG